MHLCPDSAEPPYLGHRQRVGVEPQFIAPERIVDGQSLEVGGANTHAGALDATLNFV